MKNIKFYNENQKREEWFIKTILYGSGLDVKVVNTDGEFVEGGFLIADDKPALDIEKRVTDYFGFQLDQKGSLDRQSFIKLLRYYVEGYANNKKVQTPEWYIKVEGETVRVVDQNGSNVSSGILFDSNLGVISDTPQEVADYFGFYLDDHGALTRKSIILLFIEYSRQMEN